MTIIPASLAPKVGRAILLGRKNSPTIMFVGGTVGVVAATVLACKATLKFQTVLEGTKKDLIGAKSLDHQDYTKADYRKDVAYIYIRTGVQAIRMYGPAVAVGTLSVMSLTGSHVVLTKRNTALTAAYAALEKGFSEYRQRVIKEIGPERERELRHAVEPYEVVDSETGKKHKVKIAGPQGDHSIYARFFDPTAKEWSHEPEYNLVYLHAQQTMANDLLHARGHLFLNEVYDMLGIERSRAGQVVGWIISKDGDNFVDFGLYDSHDPEKRAFINGQEGSILLDFNVDGIIYDKIKESR